MTSYEIEIIIKLLSDYDNLISEQTYSDNDEGDYYYQKDNDKRKYLSSVIKILKQKAGS